MLDAGVVHAAAFVARRRLRLFKSSLGMYSLDAGVGVGLLMLVDPAGWDPFGEPVDIELAAPAFLQKMRVVVSAEQGEIVNTALNVPSG